MFPDKADFPLPELPDYHIWVPCDCGCRDYQCTYCKRSRTLGSTRGQCPNHPSLRKDTDADLTD